MDKESRILADKIGQCIVDRDFSAARALLAPWLNQTEADLARMIDQANEGLAQPKSWTVDEGVADLATLRKPDDLGPPSKPLPQQITTANFRDWICVQFQPDPDNEEGFNVCFDLWLAVVRHEGTYSVGYLEAWEAT